jgi:hypothetical protein
MNRDREEIEKQLPFKLPGSNKKPVWERLSKRDYMLSQSMRLEAHKGCPLPAFHHTHSANYSQLAMEVAMEVALEPENGAREWSPRMEPENGGRHGARERSLPRQIKWVYVNDHKHGTCPGAKARKLPLSPD